MKVTRRTLLRASLASAAFGGSFGRWGLLNAATPASGDYRALVCVFLFGGNDSNNLIVPLDTKTYEAYSGIRKTLALPAAQLLPVEAGKGAYGFHPKMTGLQKLFSDQHAAIVLNVGTLVQPISRQQYMSNQGTPSNLFSHSDQQMQWQTSVAQGNANTGWGGRLADSMSYLNLPAKFPTFLSVSGNAFQGTGEDTRPAAVIPNAPLGLRGFDNSAASAARMKSLQELLTFDSGAKLVQQAAQTMAQGLNDTGALSKALAGAPALSTTFPTTSLGSQLQQIAKIIQVRSELGMTRQIFFCSLGGFDTHTNQLNDQDNLFNQVNNALAAFFAATQELGVADKVTTFTESDFARTLQPNTNGGTDHAWGGHHIVMGGAVKGGALYGAFPEFALGGPNDAGSEGRWIPQFSIDQYGATLAAWFGATPQSLTSVFPNLANFQQSDIGFMG